MESAKPARARPFVKWAGGKGQLLKQLHPLFPKKFSTYYEPFLGGGAVFFSLSPKKAIINDINVTLANTYRQIRSDVDSLIEELKKIEKKFLSAGEDGRREFYYKIRDRYNSLPPEDLKRCSLFIFLNRTGFNGMYRENSSGKMNIPFGRNKNPKILNEENLRAIAETLHDIEISSNPFEKAVSRAKKDDFVYFDPPYDPISSTSSFTAYTGSSFAQEDQIRLRDLFVKLDKKGVFVMLSNSSTPFIKNLYKNYRQVKVRASRMINSKTADRGEIDELVVLNY
ncbi:MAG: DNA adenine methylase [Candidatus Taylorbacteria bacterium]|nr:DNA adenine methylase [Candidatus Taylorbacteria bacterium]